MTRDTNGSTTVGNTTAELADVAGLVATSETHVIVFTVDGNVLVVPGGELLDGGLDDLHSSRFPHGLGGEVAVASGTVPVTSEGLGVEGDLDTPLLGDTDEEVASHPEMVTHRDTLTRADLELPLRGHNLSVDTRDVDAGVEAGAIVGFDQITSEDLAGACGPDQNDDLDKIRIGRRTYQHRSSRGLGVRGNHPWASQRDCRRRRRGCTPARDRTRAPGLLSGRKSWQHGDDSWSCWECRRCCRSRRERGCCRHHGKDP